MFFARFSCVAALLLATQLGRVSSLHAQMMGNAQIPSQRVELYRPTSSLPQRPLPIFGNLRATNPVERVLASRVTLQVDDETTVAEFAKMLRERFKINVLIDSRALDDIGLGSDTPMEGIEVERVELETAINVILEQLDLCFYVRDHILIITTPEEAENNLSTYVYPVANLLDMWLISHPGDTSLYADYESLIEVITSTLSPDSWDEVGGAGAIEVYDDSQALVISQTRDVHKQIQALLDTLRKARSIQPAPRGNLPSNVGSVPYRPSSVPYRPGSTPGGGFGTGSHPANMGGHF